MTYFLVKTTRTAQRLCRVFVQTGVLLVWIQPAQAATFALPNAGDSLIDNNQGLPHYVKAQQEDTLIDIAVQHLLGQEEVVRANKKVDRWLPGAGKEVLIPSSYLLPDAPRKGIVINLPEYRIYYYSSATEVLSYAVGIGRVDWKTPLGMTSVVGKTQNPTWTPPASIKEEHRLKGDILPNVWPAGPDNPLGLFAFRLGIPGYLLHSTNKPQGIGMQVSHGCMRLYPKDIESLFQLAPVGTQVNIINQPIKVGWSNGNLYIESHPVLEGEVLTLPQRVEIAAVLIQKALNQQLVSIDAKVLETALKESNGLPTLISNGGVPVEILNLEVPADTPAAVEPNIAVPEVVPAPVIVDVPVAPKSITPAPVIVDVPVAPKSITPAPVIVDRPVIPEPAPKKIVPKVIPKKTVEPKIEIPVKQEKPVKQERVFENSPMPFPSL